jgi:hypothetical protein
MTNNSEKAPITSKESTIVDQLMNAPFATAAMRRHAAEMIATLMVERDDAKAQLERLTKDHEQYVEWALPQLERLGREMAENDRLRGSPETREARTTDERLAELAAQCQDLWRTNITMVCRLPKGHDGDHRGDNGWTWNGNTQKAGEPR